MKHFPSVERVKALERPILYSNWLSKDYMPDNRAELRDYVKARLNVFYEEELDVPLVLFDEVLEHVSLNRSFLPSTARSLSADWSFRCQKDHPLPFRRLDERTIHLPNQGSQQVHQRRL